LHFHSDAAYEMRGVNMSYAQYTLPGCPPEWTVGGGRCYRLYAQPARDWLDAQRQCALDQARLLTFDTQQQYTLVMQLFDKQLRQTLRILPWIGLFDASVEGTFTAVDDDTIVWPSRCVCRT
jgi:hypothetical protein